jgi:hypothetical protein
MSKGYLFNPFTIATEDTDVLQAEYKRLVSTLDHDADVPFEIAKNIEVYANMNIIVGEMIARYKNEVDNMKSEIKAQESLQVYKQRDVWIKSHEGKPPAMSYFEALAYDFVKGDYIKLNASQEKLTRFKYAYDSHDNKINAMKKRYDAAVHEVGYNV